MAFGIGIPPTKFEPRVMSVGLNKDYSTTIHFKNPFKESINVTVTMEAKVINQISKSRIRIVNDNYLNRARIKKFSNFSRKLRKMKVTRRRCLFQE